MKNMIFLLSMVSFVMIVQNVQTRGDDCTNVSVTYTGLDPRGLPDDTRQISAWHVTRCGETHEDYYWSFKLPYNAKGQTTWKVTTTKGGFKKGQQLWLSPAGIDPPKDCVLTMPVTGSQINVECNYDHGICQKCVLK